MEKLLVDKDCLLEKFSGKGGWTYAEILEVQITSLLFLPYCALEVVHLIRKVRLHQNLEISKNREIWRFCCCFWGSLQKRRSFP